MNNLWKWLDGKKTSIASVYWFVSSTLLVIWFPSGAPDPWNKINLTIGAIFTAVGLGHKVIKQYIGIKE